MIFIVCLEQGTKYVLCVNKIMTTISRVPDSHTKCPEFNSNRNRQDSIGCLMTLGRHSGFFCIPMSLTPLFHRHGITGGIVVCFNGGLPGLREYIHC